MFHISQIFGYVKNINLMKNIYDFSKSETLIYLNKAIFDKNLIILDQISFFKKRIY